MTDDRKRLPRKVIWRRIDVEGMDACSFDLSGNGYAISGTAIYQDRAGPVKLNYRVICNPDWSSNAATVSGWHGSAEKELTLSRSRDDLWIIHGQAIGGVDSLLDVDLGFTPATNTNAIRRLRLKVGGEVETTAVWLDTADWRFKPLRQVYRRLSETEFAYSSPSHDYAANLVTDDYGIIQLYPQLWTAVSHPGSFES